MLLFGLPGFVAIFVLGLPFPAIVIGAGLGGWLAPRLGIKAESPAANWAVAIGGAVLLIVILRAIGIPQDMFTVMFSIGRLPGWISQWKEMRANPASRINRPRQIYTGETARPWVPLDER